MISQNHTFAQGFEKIHCNDEYGVSTEGRRDTNSEYLKNRSFDALLRMVLKRKLPEMAAG